MYYYKIGGIIIKISTRKLVLISLLIAMKILLSDILSIQLMTFNINLSYIPTAFAGILLGPIYAGITSVIADLIGFFIFSGGYSFFIGYPISAFLGGAIYGSILYKKPKSIIRICISVTLVAIFVNILLGTLWISILYGKSFIFYLPTRIIENLIRIPSKTLVIYLLCKSLNSFIISYEQE